MANSEVLRMATETMIRALAVGRYGGDAVILAVRPIIAQEQRPWPRFTDEAAKQLGLAGRRKEENLYMVIRSGEIVRKCYRLQSAVFAFLEELQSDNIRTNARSKFLRVFDDSIKDLVRVMDHHAGYAAAVREDPEGFVGALENGGRYWESELFVLY